MSKNYIKEMQRINDAKIENSESLFRPGHTVAEAVKLEREHYVE